METQNQKKVGDKEPRQSTNKDHPWLNTASEEDSIGEAIRSSLNEIRIA